MSGIFLLPIVTLTLVMAYGFWELKNVEHAMVKSNNNQ